MHMMLLFCKYFCLRRSKVPRHLSESKSMCMHMCSICETEFHIDQTRPFYHIEVFLLVRLRRKYVGLSMGFSWLEIYRNLPLMWKSHCHVIPETLNKSTCLLAGKTSRYYLPMTIYRQLHQHNGFVAFSVAAKPECALHCRLTFDISG